MLSRELSGDEVASVELPGSVFADVLLIVVAANRITRLA
jgi:hypothetical protein